jgi:hypothetical protein
MEARTGSLSAAKTVALEALELQPAFGRLWSALATVEHGSANGIDAAMNICHQASKEVPKSGEVWCEFARVFLNPLGAAFHLDRAHKSLQFALRLTPQYGDTFLELLRLRFLLEIRCRMKADPVTAGFLSASSSAPPAEKSGDSGACSPRAEEQRLVVAALVARRVCQALSQELKNGSICISGADSAPKAVFSEQEGAEPHLAQLETLCAYADPNYGFLWFWCRQGSMSSPREVLQKMHEELVKDLLSGGTLWSYVWAVARGIFGFSAGSMSKEADIARQAKSELGLGSRHAPPLVTQDFAVGSMRLSRCFAHGCANLEQAERWQLIFGSDILCA